VQPPRLRIAAAEVPVGVQPDGIKALFVQPSQETLEAEILVDLADAPEIEIQGYGPIEGIAHESELEGVGRKPGVQVSFVRKPKIVHVTEGHEASAREKPSYVLELLEFRTAVFLQRHVETGAGCLGHPDENCIATTGGTPVVEKKAYA
jgi:hypothetical protein